MADSKLIQASHLAPGDVVGAPELAGMTGIRHAFFTRKGGVSADIYASLNMGIGSRDAPEAVRENRARAAHFLGLPGTELTTPWQVHSKVAVAVDRPFAADRPHADGIVTATPGLAVGVVTADCGPILFADPVARVVGAAHAGWRGATGGVIEATIAAMEGLGARCKDIVAVLGPTITQRNYEIGADMAGAILADHTEAGRFFAPGVSDDKRQFDLPGFILSRIEAAGATGRFVGHCTYGDEERFFSFRRTTHRGEPDYGRQLAAIAIDK